MSSQRPGLPLDAAALAAALGALADVALMGAATQPKGSSKALDRVVVAAGLMNAARECLDDSVRRARSDGASWLEVGQVLGISRQAAFQRFGS